MKPDNADALLEECFRQFRDIRMLAEADEMIAGQHDRAISSFDDYVSLGVTSAPSYQFVSANNMGFMSSSGFQPNGLTVLSSTGRHAITSVNDDDEEDRKDDFKHSSLTAAIKRIMGVKS